MTAYRAKPSRAGLINDPEQGLAATAEVIIFPGSDDGVDTGLLDAQGNRLFRYRDPVGFRIR